MNELVIIGNGFDLAHGLKTRYNDFMIWYLNDAIEVAHKKKLYTDKLISLDSSSSPYVAVSKIDIVKDFKPTINKFKYNFSHSSDFFNSLIDNYTESNWVDIESEYYNQLVRNYRGYNNSPAKEEKLIYLNRIKDLNKSLSYIKEKLNEYLNFIDTESFKKNETIENHIKMLMERIKINHLNLQLSNGKILFLNFNYTNTINNYLEKYHRNYFEWEIINIHGNLKDKNSIVFGYGDMMDDNYENLEKSQRKDLLEHIKHFYYLQTQEYHKLIKFIENCSMDTALRYTANIFGHSCGVSDRVLLNRVFNRESCKSIKIYWHQIDETHDDFFEKTQNISRHISKENKKYIEIISNKTQCSPLTKWIDSI